MFTNYREADRKAAYWEKRANQMINANMYYASYHAAPIVMYDNRAEVEQLKKENQVLKDRIENQRAYLETKHDEIAKLKQSESDLARQRKNQAETIQNLLSQPGSPHSLRELQDEIARLKTINGLQERTLETVRRDTEARISKLKAAGEEHYRQAQQKISALNDELTVARQDAADAKFALEYRDMEVRNQSLRIQALRIIIDSAFGIGASSYALSNPNNITKLFGGKNIG